MADKTNIEWTDATWNPIRGCQRVSPGCKNCYAERVAARFSGDGLAYEGLARLVTIGAGTPAAHSEARWTGVIHQVEEHFYDPLRWKRPRKIFVNSMSDLFILEHSAGDWVLDRLFAVMALSPRHTFQVLTKRPKRMLEYLSAPGRKSEIMGHMATISFDEMTLVGRSGKLLPGTSLNPDKEIVVGDLQWPLPNVWLGVSVESQEYANERIPLLLQTPAAVRWISAEPLLGAVDLTHIGCTSDSDPGYSALEVGEDDEPIGADEFDAVLDWVVVGGESGPGARPMHPQWARSLQRQCARARVPFFFKQWGQWKPVGPLYAKSDTKEHVEALDMLTYFPRRSTTLALSGCRWDEDGFQPPPGSWVMESVGKKKAGAELNGAEIQQWPGHYPAQTFAGGRA